MNTLPERLAHTRNMRGYTQSALAKAIRVSRGVITNIEYGKAAPSPIVLAAICSTLNINEQWLLTGDGPMQPDNKRSKMLNELYEACSRLSEAEQRFVLETIRSMQKLVDEPTEKRETNALLDMLHDVESRKTAKPPGAGREPEYEK